MTTNNSGDFPDLQNKGDLLVGDGASRPSVLSVGANDQVLTADSTQATGLKWATNAASGGSLVFLNKQTISSPVASVDFTSLLSTTYNNYVLKGVNIQSDHSIEDALRMRISSDNGSSWISAGNYSFINSDGSSANNATTYWRLASSVEQLTNSLTIEINFMNLTANAGFPAYFSNTVGLQGSTSDIRTDNYRGLYESPTLVNAFQLYSAFGNIEAGIFTLYGIAES